VGKSNLSDRFQHTIQHNLQRNIDLNLMLTDPFFADLLMRSWYNRMEKDTSLLWTDLGNWSVRFQTKSNFLRTAIRQRTSAGGKPALG